MADQSESQEFPAFGAGCVEAERERGAFAKRQNGGEQIQFLRRHFGETVEPQVGNVGVRKREVRKCSRSASVAKSSRQFASCNSCSASQSRVSVEQQREVIEFVAKFGRRVRRCASARSLAGVN